MESYTLCSLHIAPSSQAPWQGPESHLGKQKLRGEACEDVVAAPVLRAQVQAARPAVKVAHEPDLHSALSSS